MHIVHIKCDAINDGFNVRTIFAPQLLDSVSMFLQL